MIILQERILLDTRAQAVNLDGSLSVLARTVTGRDAAEPLFGFLPSLAVLVLRLFLGLGPFLGVFSVTAHPSTVVADRLSVSVAFHVGLVCGKGECVVVQWLTLAVVVFYVMLAKKLYVASGKEQTRRGGSQWKNLVSRWSLRTAKEAQDSLENK